jgi:hypothetical protein
MTGRKVTTLLFFSLNITFLTVVRPSHRLITTQTFITLSSRNEESEYEMSPPPDKLVLLEALPSEVSDIIHLCDELWSRSPVHKHGPQITSCPT